MERLHDSDAVQAVASVIGGINEAIVDEGGETVTKRTKMAIIASVGTLVGTSIFSPIKSVEDAIVRAGVGAITSVVSRPILARAMNIDLHRPEHNKVGENDQPTVTDDANVALREFRIESGHGINGKDVGTRRASGNGTRE